KLLEKYAKLGIVSNEPTTEYERSFGNAISDGFKNFPKNLGRLFNKPPRTPLEIARMKNQTQILESFEKSKVIPKEETVRSKEHNDLLGRLESIEEKVDSLESSLKDSPLVTDPSRVVLTEMKSNELEDKYGKYLAQNSEFLEAIKNRDPDKMDKVLVDAMMNYCADIYDDKHFATPLEQFKQVLEGLCANGCQTAMFIKAQALLGRDQTVKEMMAMSFDTRTKEQISEDKNDLSNMYQRDDIAGIKVLKNVNPDTTLVVHPNVRDSGKMHINDLLPSTPTPNKGVKNN
ncbi:MAG: hypothetical protein AB7V32_00705, partial [Candidatus Berkiella sp.]